MTKNLHRTATQLLLPPGYYSITLLDIANSMYPGKQQHRNKSCISGNNRQKRTFDTPRQQSKVKLTHRIVILTPVSLYSRCESHLQPVATRKPGSIETICGTFQTKVAENCDDELTQSAHLRNPCLALHTTVGYTFLRISCFFVA